MRSEYIYTKIKKALPRTAALVFAAVLLLQLALPAAVYAADGDAPEAEPMPSLDGVEAAYLYNCESKKAVCSKNPEKLVYPASTVKLMSALVALEALSDRLDEKVTITAEMITGVTGTRYGLAAGDSMTIRDLFYIAYTGCYNDAVVALAILACGDLTAFIARMNARAGEIGMTNTHYTNPTGMHDRLMRTTAADVSKLALVLSGNEFYMRVTSEPKYTLEGTEKKYTVSNRNELVSKVTGTKNYNQLCHGMNVGMTEDAGYSLTTVATKDGATYICVIMGGKELEGGKNTAYSTANDIIAWAFRNYGYREVVSTSTVICEVPVTLSSDADSVLLVPASSYHCYLPTSAVIGTDITFTSKLTVDSLEAPVSAGVECGFLTVKYGDDELAVIPLVTKSDVEGSRLLKQMEEIREFSQSRVFIATVVSAVVITLLYYAIRAFIRASKQKKHGRYYL